MSLSIDKKIQKLWSLVEGTFPSAQRRAMLALAYIESRRAEDGSISVLDYDDAVAQVKIDISIWKDVPQKMQSAVLRLVRAGASLTDLWAHKTNIIKIITGEKIFMELFETFLEEDISVESSILRLKGLTPEQAEQIHVRLMLGEEWVDAKAEALIESPLPDPVVVDQKLTPPNLFPDLYKDE